MRALSPPTEPNRWPRVGLVTPPPSPIAPNQGLFKRGEGGAFEDGSSTVPFRRRRRRSKRKMIPTIAEIAMTPPTTPPAIAPVLLLELDEDTGEEGVTGGGTIPVEEEPRSVELAVDELNVVEDGSIVSVEDALSVDVVEKIVSVVLSEVMLENREVSVNGGGTRVWEVTRPQRMITNPAEWEM